MTESSPKRNRPTVVQCPTCGKSVEWTEASKWRPFCCERCRLIDLGAWASEEYQVPGSNGDAGTPSDDEPQH